MEYEKKGGGGSRTAGNPAAALIKRLAAIHRQSAPPPAERMLRLCAAANQVYRDEAPDVRPLDDAGEPGGIINLSPDLPTVVVPDLHARTDFLLSVMLHPFDGEATALEMLSRGLMQVICLGDGFHAEGRAAQRWKRAFDEFQGGYNRHRSMDEEMKESLGVMQMVMEVKTAFPLHFHFLKGNHENIANENGGGNYPFRKYAYEGAMVLEYVRKFYGLEFLDTYYRFEKNLPLLAVGGNFLVSHAEPKKLFKADRVRNYRRNPEVVYGLTWTDNDEADEGSVARMLAHYLPQETREGAKYFGGHRTVSDRYQERAGGDYIQIHNPHRFQVALCRPGEPVDPETCIVDVEKRI